MQALTRSELLVHLGSRRALDAAVAAGTWTRVLRGAYVAGPVVDVEVRAAAALRLLPRRALVADRSLLRLLGVDVLPPGPPVLEAVVARGAVVPQRQGVRVRETDLPRRDRCTVDGVPALRPVRAVADLLRLLPRTEAVVVADAVQHVALCTREDLEEELVQHAGLRGVRGAGAVLTLSDRLAESPPESRVRLLLVDAGLRPVAQHEVHDRSGRWLARVDLAFPEARVAVEYDGRLVHQHPRAFIDDRQRQNRLVSAGWVVLRYTAEDLARRPYAVVQDVRAALLSAA